MPWARLDDGLLGHAKFEEMDDDHLGFWTRGLLHANRNLTNGRIPRRFVKTKAHMLKTAVLVRIGLWHRAKGLQNACPACYEMVGRDPGDGWVIHDFLEYNPSKEQVQRTRRMNRERQARYRDSRAVTPLVTQEEGVTNDTPIPSVPGPSGPEKEKDLSITIDPHVTNGNGQIHENEGETPEEARARIDRMTEVLLKSFPPVTRIEVRAEATRNYGRPLDSEELA